MPYYTISGSRRCRAAMYPITADRSIGAKEFAGTIFTSDTLLNPPLTSNKKGTKNDLKDTTIITELHKISYLREQSYSENILHCSFSHSK